MESETANKPAKTVEQQAEIFERLRQEVGKAIVGQEKVFDRMLMALICKGHVLLEGVPGIAKTTLVRSLAKAIDVDFHRISFTPDLLPADIVGTMIYNPKDGTFSPKKGPVFTNILLADEINRAPAKVQSALLEAMQERQVTVGDNTYKLPSPFMVLATQNPIEQEGTYPLPEAQVDRFMFKCIMKLPPRDDERRIVSRFTKQHSPEIKPVIHSADISGLRSTLEQVYCDEKVGEYMLDIVFCTREPERFNLACLLPYIEYGASPRASLYLNLAARASAMLHGRSYATPQDVKEIAADVLRHRVIVTYEAEAEEITSDKLIDKILTELPVP